MSRKVYNVSDYKIVITHDTVDNQLNIVVYDELGEVIDSLLIYDSNDEEDNIEPEKLNNKDNHFGLDINLN